MKRADADARSLVFERQLPHPPEKVWRALTEPVPHWNGVTDCEVLDVAPNERLAYTWNASGEEAAGGLKTVVTWTLTPISDGTQLRVEHSGFRPEEDARNLQGASYGWARFLDGLERVVADLDGEPSARR